MQIFIDTIYVLAYACVYVVYIHSSMCGHINTSADDRGGQGPHVQCQDGQTGSGGETAAVICVWLHSCWWLSVCLFFAPGIQASLPHASSLAAVKISWRRCRTHRPRCMNWGLQQLSQMIPPKLSQKFLASRHFGFTNGGRMCIEKNSENWHEPSRFVPAIFWFLGCLRDQDVIEWWKSVDCWYEYYSVLLTSCLKYYSVLLISQLLPSHQKPSESEILLPLWKGSWIKLQMSCCLWNFHRIWDHICI